MTTQHLAFVFPGQGSQQVGMLQELTTNYAIARQTFDEASSALGYDMLTLATQGPEEKLNQTEYTQPALLTAGVAVYRVIQQLHPTIPAIMAGHSLGEYTALVCANSLSFSDAVQLVAERGRLMQEAVPQGIGAMAAIIGLEPAQVETVCHEAAQGEIVAPANINAIGQIVISGHKAAVERAVVIAKTMGAKIAKLIPVSVPSHCDLMRPAAEKLMVRLAATDIKAPNCTLIHNADVTAHQQADQIRQVLAAQLYSPVRWVETIQTFAQKGITRILELGPGKVLTGLNKRIDSNIETLPIYDEATLQQAFVAMGHDSIKIG
jgi:[acyl-carrier-protein] S-malonyltransferase